MFDRSQRRAKARAQQATARLSNGPREELDRVAFEVLENRFGDRLRSRRRRTAATALVAGIALGVTLGHLLHR